MKRLIVAAALAASAAAAPAAVASPGVEGCVGERCLAVSLCDLAAEGCERPPPPWPPRDCVWIRHGDNLWYVVCW